MPVPIDNNFWRNPGTFREAYYTSNGGSSNGGGTLMGPPGLVRPTGATPSWEFCERWSFDGKFTAYNNDGTVFSWDIGVEELVRFLLRNGRPGAAESLRVFCRDSGIEWLPENDMELYLVDKDQIWDRFASRLKAARSTDL